MAGVISLEAGWTFLGLGLPKERQGSNIWKSHTSYMPSRRQSSSLVDSMQHCPGNDLFFSHARTGLGIIPPRKKMIEN